MNAGATVGLAIQLALSLVVFWIAFRRNRRYFHRSILGAGLLALAAALICPEGALVYYAISSA